MSAWTSFFGYFFPSKFSLLRIRKARESDAKAVFSIVNAAYSVELGNTGLAFKSVDRYRNLGEVRRDLHEIYVARENECVAE